MIISQRRLIFLVVAAALAGLLVLMLVMNAGATQPRSTGPVVEAGIDSPAVALTDLDQLTVLARRPNLAGYERGCAAHQACSFGPAWTDDQDAPGGHNGCDTRDDVLAAQLRSVAYRSGSNCVVVSGVLDDPYTARTIKFTKAQATAVQIDHVVPLALAWDLGAAHWTQAQRTAYANDAALVLLAVDGQSNEEKSDAGPGEWMPANRGDWCPYDQRIVTVLTHYQLSVTAADKAALETTLTNCSG